MKNLFKFGSIVEGSYFTNRTAEIEKINSILNSKNHLIIISPRRFGKTSLIKKVVSELNRPNIYLDLQVITSIEDLSAQLLKRIYRIYPSEKFKTILKSLKILPTVSINPLNNEIDISFQAVQSDVVLIEDVFNLINKLSARKNPIIVIFDEFQSIKDIGKDLDKKLRAVIQHHQKVNYVFLGSQESLMRDIFEKKKSPFYHFGYMLPISKIPFKEFAEYLNKRFAKISSDSYKLSEAVLAVTNAHPYYTQQLAFTIFDLLQKEFKEKSVVDESINELLQIHDMDFERLWNTLNKTDKKILIGMSKYKISPMAGEFSSKVQINSSSTIFSSLKRLMIKGVVIQSNSTYEIDDPFFKRWIIKKEICENDKIQLVKTGTKNCRDKAA
ncbi:MAG: ATPase [Ignavibacteriae bacterium]|nr:MAG: ATPase [Ignavibacteriota bacterium]